MKKYINKIIAVFMSALMLFSSISVLAAVSATTVSKYTGKTYTHNAKFRDRTLKNGIDLSYHNGALTDADWQAFKKQGVEFVMLRVGYRGYGSEGTLSEKTKDAKFDTYIKSAQKVGLPVGVYIYSQAISTKEAEEEANFVLKYIQNYKIDLPVVFDYEFAESNGSATGRLWNKYRSLGAANTKVAFTNNCLAFCKIIRNAGYTPMLYASASFIKDYMNPTVLANNNCKVWLAHYTTKSDYNYDYEFWQYSATGKFNGVIYRTADGEVSKVGQQKVFDVNFWYMPNVEKEPESSSGSVVGVSQLGKVTDLSVVSSNVNSCTLEWSAVESATGYEILRINGSKTTSLGTATKTTYTASGLESAVDIQLKVRAYVKNGSKTTYGEASDPVIFTTNPKKPVLTLASTNTTITLTWTKQANVDGTNIYYYDYDAGAYKFLKEIKGTANSYKVTGLKASTKYRYRVRAYKLDKDGKKLWSSYADGVTRYTNPSTPTIKSAVYTSSKKFKTTWSKVSTISGYQVEWSTSSTFSSNTKKKDVSASATSNVISTYYSKKYYYVRVRAYKTRNNVRQYSPWSKTLKVYIKK